MSTAGWIRPANDIDWDAHDLPDIQCCVCGAPVIPNPSNMCISCIQNQVDITSGIVPNGPLMWCKECERYLNPPKIWTEAAPESKELLELCLKRLKGMSKLKLADAEFVWTEPHSKRLKVCVTVQAELPELAHLNVQQDVVVEFVIQNKLCPDCIKEATGQNVWTAVVQVRQKVEHKRTFLNLENQIIKQNLQRECTRVQTHPDGIDFFYSSKQRALRMVEFLRGAAPIKVSESQEMVSHNAKSNTAEIHFTWMIEIAPICKDDLILLPPRVSQGMGGMGPFVICAKVNTGLVLLDPITLQMNTVSSAAFWKHPFEAFAGPKQLTEFYILDVQAADKPLANGKYKMAEVHLQKSDEVGSGQEYFVKTHMGGLLQPGELVMGYLVYNLNSIHRVEGNKKISIPEVVLVKKLKS